MNQDLKTEMHDLEESIDSIEEKLNEVSSKKNVFKLGIIRGLGTAFGATVLFAVVMGLLAWFVSATNIPWIEQFIPETEFGESLTN
jgi:hypothetical protein